MLLPTLLFELLLHINNNLFEKILLDNSDFTEWSAAAPVPNIWPGTIIMGSSYAKEGIDPAIIEKQLKAGGINTQIGSIAINADSTSTDFLTLKRILKTCKKCPNTIVYEVTDVSLRDHETVKWIDFTKDKILKLYWPDPQIDSLLHTAASEDDYFRDYLPALEQQKIFRLTFTKGRFINMAFNKLYSFITHGQDQYEPIYSDFTNIDHGAGYFSYGKTLTPNVIKESLDQYKDYLQNYNVGGVTKLFLINFLELAGKNKIKVYLVLTPKAKIYLDTFAAEQKLFNYEVASIVKTEKLPLIDATKFNYEDKSIFTNTNHLNTKGSKLFSVYLGNQLAKIWDKSK